MDMATLVGFSVVIVGAVVIMIAVHHEAKRKEADWHHKMMLDAWQEGWDAAVSMMESREETKR